MLSNLFENFFEKLMSEIIFPMQIATEPAHKIDLSIEGMRSQQYSVGVFLFLLLGIFIFSSIVYSVVFGKYAPKTLRLGEKILFGAIIIGIIVAVIFAALQMLSGYLF